MGDNYIFDIISDEEKQRLLNAAQLAIDNLRNKIVELQQMISDNIGIPTMNAAYEVTFYIKEIIGIPNRESQKDMTTGAENDSYYHRFIPIKKQNVVIDLRISDHIRKEEWSDKKDDGAHPNIRANAIVKDTYNSIPKASVQKHHKVNGCKVKRFIQRIPTTVYGTPQQIIKHLNTLICLFQNGEFGKYKGNKQRLNCNMNIKQHRNIIRLTESDLHKIVTETANRLLFGYHKNNVLITESQESKSISAAKTLVMNKLGYDEEQADEFVRIKLRGDIPVLRTKQGGKFIFGVTRMFCDGEIRDASTISNLNTTLKYVSSDAHINDYDRNLNGMSAQELIDRFAKNVEMDLENDRNQLASMQFAGQSDYNIVRIDSFEQASQYGDYTKWCVTRHEDMFNSYTSNGINQFYFCLKNGFEQVPDEPGEGCPLDDYGLSMIAVSVDENGRLNTCTCRWNHDNGGNDRIMDTRTISEVISANFYDVFKPNNVWKEEVETALQRIANGESPEDVFNFVYKPKDGFAPVELKGKYNFINQDGELLSKNQWFDKCKYFNEGFAAVKLNGKWNFINQNGELLSPNQWFDAVYPFYDGIAKVNLKRKWNFIDQNGELLWKQWF